VEYDNTFRLTEDERVETGRRVHLIVVDTVHMSVCQCWSQAHICMMLSFTSFHFTSCSVNCTVAVVCKIKRQVSSYWRKNKRVVLSSLTLWRQNYFFLILAHPVYKMGIIQEPNTLQL